MGYPFWWQSALCRVMQLQLCDILDDGKYGVLKSILVRLQKTAGARKETFHAIHVNSRHEGAGKDLFFWTEFPIVLLQPYFQSGVEEVSKAEGGKGEFGARLNLIWASVVPS